MIVHIVNKLSDHDLGSFEVESFSELQAIAATHGPCPLDIDGEMHTVRFHGCRMERQGHELVGILYVSEGA